MFNWRPSPISDRKLLRKLEADCALRLATHTTQKSEQFAYIRFRTKKEEARHKSERERKKREEGQGGMQTCERRGTLHQKRSKCDYCIVYRRTAHFPSLIYLRPFAWLLSFCSFLLNVSSVQHQMNGNTSGSWKWHRGVMDIKMGIKLFLPKLTISFLLYHTDLRSLWILI